MQKQGQAQRETVLNHLKNNPRGTTIKEMRELYDISTPNARISELVQAGWDIKKDWREISRKGRWTREIVYTLASPNKGLPVLKDPVQSFACE